MRQAPALYLVTDRTAHAAPLPDQVAAALSQVDPRRVAVQLREKDLGAAALCELGRSVLSVCRARGVPMLVNDRLDVALALGADGVHLGGGALPASVARSLFPEGLIAISSHGVAELRERAPGADFAVWGPVFPTPSKARYGAPVGPPCTEDLASAPLPLLALGGVDASNAQNLARLGFCGVACIRAVFSAQDPALAAHELLAAFDRRTGLR